ncbi:hypothetical protein PQR14_14650 [Paraburkholderia bryophila]|uniref:hypothetical protein n=1 Tax=Burkholderiaceae TaxID=119060 RepID=UPI0012E0B595|nr:hypothetical protein [Burkholderia sp. 9120]
MEALDAVMASGDEAQRKKPIDAVKPSFAAQTHVNFAIWRFWLDDMLGKSSL